MRWSWQEFEGTPTCVIERIVETAREEHEARQREEQLRELKSRRGRGF